MTRMTEQNESAAPELAPEQSGPDVAEPGKLPKSPALPVEIGGQKGPEPTRYGDWEKNGRCTDF